MISNGRVDLCLNYRDMMTRDRQGLMNGQASLFIGRITLCVWVWEGVMLGV